ncbi:predicted protein [Naegleria gruberi]|uniref:Predicted protein n=1 Tax=Naegleria gruberi TaxID=5762 RepID=D2VNK5_NAEGR|nr:uncharacterized protein NAEGRDRAFT_51021 [Naegleria gruberi]EFC41675.1 predicted protein [Naegleria gruberi]|eukprot:XP_002674419.1 predicted protein [Naegleria gruberi strain NEG-M]
MKTDRKPYHPQNSESSNSSGDDEDNFLEIKEKRSEPQQEGIMSNSLPSSSTYHHFKLPSTVLSKRERSINYHSNSTPPPSNSSQIYQRQSVSISGSTAVAMEQSSLNIVDETDKTTIDIERRKKKRKKMKNSHNYLNGGGENWLHDDTLKKDEEDEHVQDDSPNSTNSEDETLKVYAFEKPLLSNSSTFKDNYFILAPVSNSSSTSSSGTTSSSRKQNSFSNDSSSHHSAQFHSNNKKKQFSPQAHNHHSTNSSNSLPSSSLSPSPHVVQAQSPLFISPPQPVNVQKYMCNSHSDSNTFTRRFVLNEPTMTIYEKNPLNNSPANQQESIGYANVQDSMSMQLFSQIVQLLIQRYQHQLDDLLESPNSLAQNIIRGLNNNEQSQQFNNLSSAESTPSNNVSIEEIYSFILQNQNLLSKKDNNQ